MLKLKAQYAIDPFAEKYGGHSYCWPSSEQKRLEFYAIKRERPNEAQSIYLCAPGQREGSLFLESDFAYFRQPKNSRLENGIFDSITQEFVEKGHLLVISWDTAVEEDSSAAYTVGTVGLLKGCTSYHCDEDSLIYGECDFHYDVLILDVFRERIGFADLVKSVRQMHGKWHPHLHIIEKKQSGNQLLQSLEKIGINTLGVNAHISKRARATQSIGASTATGWFRQHRVYFPSEEPDPGTSMPRPISWLNDLKRELKDFTGDESGTTDQVDSMIHLLHYVMAESTNATLMESDWSVETVDQHMGINIDFDPINDLPNDNLLRQIAVWNNDAVEPFNPFGDTCSQCKFYNANRKEERFSSTHCHKHARLVTAFDSCDDFAEKGKHGH